jgi:ribosome-associated protein
MADTQETKAMALEIGRCLHESKAEDVLVLGVLGLCSWADYLIMATSRSNAQMKGLLDELGKLSEEKGWAVPAIKKKEMDPSWLLLDWGDCVIHIMSPEGRDFFALEKLWYQAETLYSSKSS